MAEIDDLLSKFGGKVESWPYQIGDWWFPPSELANNPIWAQFDDSTLTPMDWALSQLVQQTDNTTMVGDALRRVPPRELMSMLGLEDQPGGVLAPWPVNPGPAFPDFSGVRLPSPEMLEELAAKAEPITDANRWLIRNPATLEADDMAPYERVVREMLGDQSAVVGSQLHALGPPETLNQPHLRKILERASDWSAEDPLENYVIDADGVRDWFLGDLNPDGQEVLRGVAKDLHDPGTPMYRTFPQQPYLPWGDGVESLNVSLSNEVDRWFPKRRQGRAGRYGVNPLRDLSQINYSMPAVSAASPAAVGEYLFEQELGVHPQAMSGMRILPSPREGNRFPQMVTDQMGRGRIGSMLGGAAGIGLGLAAPALYEKFVPASLKKNRAVQALGTFLGAVDPRQLNKEKNDDPTGS